MKHLVKSYLAYFKSTHPAYFSLFSNSLIIFASSILSNVFSFMFNLVTARNLSVEHYGILQTMLNLFNITSILSVLVMLQLTKQLANYISKRKYSSASALINKTNLFVIIVGLITLVFFLLINSIFNISIGSVTSENLVIVILLSILGYLLAINKALMRANLLFVALALNSNFQSASKLIFSIPLLLLGFKLHGAIWSLFISSILAIVYSVWQLRSRLFLNLFEKIHFNVKTFTKESLSTMIGFLGLTSIISTDLILVQHFIAQQAGLYAGLTIFGKGIMLTSFPLSTVLFPLIINSRNNLVGKKLFRISILGALALGLSVYLVYMLIPKQIVAFALSPSYQIIVSLLPYYGFSILLFSVSHIIVNGFIALDEFIPGYVTFLAAILQIIGIFYFHNSLYDVVIVSLFINIGLAIYLTVFTFFRLHTITKKYYDSKLLSID